MELRALANGDWTPACAGVTTLRQCGKECNVSGPLRLRKGDVDTRLLLCLSAPVNHPHRIDGQCH